MNDVPVSDAVEMLAEVSGIPSLDPESKFGALDLDSLMLIEWVSMLEERFGVEFDIRDLAMSELDALSIGDAIAALGKRAVSA